uniref:anthranilate synthase n=1 Tax=Rhodosorus marinus TaxID=101924 RepID=A0A7S0G3H3_9RHOD|mmetsp:Transcript_19898/g.28980  ORF Transcript_19898/g.28980 Transcript_19898/m.28980 type:complete len:587 (+) Transcript_19898:144-1904(+)
MDGLCFTSGASFGTSFTGRLVRNEGDICRRGRGRSRDESGRRVVRASIVSPVPTIPTSNRDGEGTSLCEFENRCSSEPGVNLVPVWRKIFSDQLTAVALYRRLVGEDDVEKTSYVLESVTTDGNVGRYSFVGADPVLEIIAKEREVTVLDSRIGKVKETTKEVEDPWALVKEISNDLKPAKVEGLPQAFSGGWVGYGGYDTARYVEAGSLPYSRAPVDDRDLPDLHMSIFQQCVTFDIINKICYVISWVDLRESSSIEAAHERAMNKLNELVDIVKVGKCLSPLEVGVVDIDILGAASTTATPVSNMTKEQYEKAVLDCKEYILQGDAFQIVYSQRFERNSKSHPFSVYRAMRIVNPSPYMIYMQCKGCVLVASSPEILCRVEDNVVTNRPLAGTRRRGSSVEEDKALEQNLLQDEKELAEHRMLVDLGRNDVGRVAKYGSVKPVELMVVERYSHVMHLSSTVVGELQDGLTSFDALRAALPAGTVSGAPKIRAMQIIDELELNRRGPYGGGIGVVSFYDDMNIALALRTMIIPSSNRSADADWKYYIQAGAGIVADSDPEAEYYETVNKAMALSRSIDLADEAFS